MVEYEPLSAISDFGQSLGDGAAKVHVDLPDNMAAKFSLSYGNIDSAFTNAAHVVAEEYFQHRGTGCPLEGRAVLANYDRLADSLMMWSATQAPHGIKRALLDYFELPDTNVRVVAPDVGGGFGPKLLVYPEEIVVPYCSSLLGRPVKWTEDRREHLMCTAQERDQLWTVKLALDKDGRFSACAAISCTTPAPSCLGASSCPISRRPPCRALMSFRRSSSTPRWCSPTEWRRRRCAAPAGRRLCSRWSGCSIVRRRNSGSIARKSVAATSSRLRRCPIKSVWSIATASP